MVSLSQYWNEFLDIFRHGLAQITNPIIGVFIALIGGLIVRNILNIFAVALLAVVIHVAAEAVIPYVLNHAHFVLPKFNHAFALYALTLYVGYFVTILAIFLVKMIFASVRG